jgi:hypothetical protein
MKNPRKLLFYFFLAYNLFLFLGAVYVDSNQNDLGFLLNIKSYIPWMKYFTFLGLVLFFVAYVVFNRDIRIVNKEVKKSKDEHTMLKAKLFDMQEKIGSDAVPSIKSKAQAKNEGDKEDTSA